MPGVTSIKKMSLQDQLAFFPHHEEVLKLEDAIYLPDIQIAALNLKLQNQRQSEGPLRT